MGSVCSFIVSALTVFYVVALGLFLIGTFGWFGSTPGPLAGVFLMPLGLPWNRLPINWNSSMMPWIAALSPLLNILILRAICKRVWG